MPTEPPLHMKQLPELPQLGTMSDLGMDMVIKEGEDLETFKSDCMKEFDRRVITGEIDVLSEM